MSYLEKDSALWRELSALAEDEDLFLYDAEKFADRGLRIVISKNSTPGADPVPGERVTSEDCSRFCRRLMVYFAAEGAQFGLRPEPEIEVSSPGVNRILRTPEHFEGAVGERIKVVWQESLGAAPTQTTTGVLQKFVGDELSVVDERSGEARTVVIEKVRKAHVDFLF